MSHISKIELEIKSLTDLKSACKELGFQFCEGQETYRWYGNRLINNSEPLSEEIKEQSKCDHAIKVGAKFEIGIRKNNDHYDLLWDDYWTGGLVEKVGEDAGLLKQAYTVQRVKSEARLKGYRVTRKKMKQGIRLTLSL